MGSHRPKAKEQRRFGEVLMPRPKYQRILERRPYPAGEHGKDKIMRRRRSDHAIQLEEKQKLRFIYSVMERQMRRYVKKAQTQQGETGKNLIVMLERRLDNMVYRMGLGATIWAARQLVIHRHILVNGQRVDRPSFVVSPNDVISLKPKMRTNIHVLQWIEEAITPPDYLDVDMNTFSATLIRIPKREEIPVPIDEQLVVEFYNRRV